MTDLNQAIRDIVGDKGFIAEPEQLIVYECDALTLEKKIPTAVVLPANRAEVIAIMQLCHAHQVPVIPRGAGTSLSGAVLAVEGGIVLCLSRMQQILMMDLPNQRALVEAGCVNAWVTRAAQEGGYYYAPDPSSQYACTLGGNVATNSGGPHTLKHGVTTNHVLGLELVLPDGEPLWLGIHPDEGEDHSGIDLRGAVIGSEGMFGVVTQVLVKLMPEPECYETLLVVFESVEQASRAVGAIIRDGIIPGALEMMDALITRAVEEAYQFGFPLDAGAILIVELDGDSLQTKLDSEQVQALCTKQGAREIRRAASAQERAELWKSRKRAFGAIGRISPNYLTQDGVVPRSKLPEIMHYITEVSSRYKLRICNVFHAGDGNIHPLVLFDERDADQTARAVQAGEAILERCLELGGSISGEHGIGVEKRSLMERQFSEHDLQAMKDLRSVFDPHGRCNPHKVFPTAKRCADFFIRKQAPA
ncbi:MAG: FAD-binding oxidoreductase [Limisphaerales bacterium]|nr:FAD-binding protein [Verrucomicrobiota bacterium]